MGVPLPLRGLLSASLSLTPALGVEAEVEADGLLVRLSDIVLVYRWWTAQKRRNRTIRVYKTSWLCWLIDIRAIYKVAELDRKCGHQGQCMRGVRELRESRLVG